jgi:two-component system response regulator FlrC
MPRVLIAEPDTALRDALAACIRDAGWDAIALDDPSVARAERHAVTLVDVADAAGVRRIETLVREGAVVVALGAAEPRRLAVEAVRAGAREFLRKPFALRALERALAAADYALRRPPGERMLATADGEMARVLRDAEAAARTDATLQIVGEPGTGRRRLARFVHAASARRGAAFVAWSGEGLAEAFAAAREGTLLVDEPAALDAAAQGALAHAVASASADGAAPRLVILARRQLRDDPRLRADLRLRLDVLAIAVPPLRERPVDVAALARDLASRAALARGVEPPRFSPAALAALCALPLPGNAHELASLMERATALFAGRDVDVPALLRSALAAPPVAASDESLDLGRLERAAIERALARTQGNRTHAARALGISVRTLRNKLREYADAAEAGR